ncbi:tetrapyrrole biosynthesis, uroporphyrinogen III synthase [Flagelloscypha sp. PMI_526]|nr:tetrapyrrole biosynthesis, uroporphyrinogen III synthase [Flagelloscypha sp. PMI_526]
MTSFTPHILLLREPSTPPSADKYEQTFLSAGFKPVSIPVLETVLTNVDHLRDVLLRQTDVDGVILTSSRSCEAWDAAIELVSTNDVSTTTDWISIPFYVVGKSTSSALSQLSSSHPDSLYVPNPSNILGSDAGNAEELARFILQRDPIPKKCLYLTGDKNRDTLPKILGEEGGIELHSLQVYRTQGSSDFPKALNRVLAEHPDPSTEWWTTFFAPSSSEFVLPTLTQHFAFLPFAPASPSQRNSRVAAIGPTTQAFLETTANIHVDAVPSKPTPEELLRTIQKSMK